MLSRHVVAQPLPMLSNARVHLTPKSADPNERSLTVDLYPIFVVLRQAIFDTTLATPKYRLVESPCRRTTPPNAFKCMCTPRRDTPKSADPNARSLTVDLYPIFVVLRQAIYDTKLATRNIGLLSRHVGPRPLAMLSNACVHLGEMSQSPLTRMRVP